MCIATSRSVFTELALVLKAGASLVFLHTLGGWLGDERANFPAMVSLSPVGLVSLFVTIFSSRFSASKSLFFSPVFSTFSALVRSVIAFITMSAGVTVGCVMYLCLKVTEFEMHSSFFF